MPPTSTLATLILVFLTGSIRADTLAPITPYATLTPGEANPQCTIDDICPHVTFRRPPVSTRLRNEVKLEYGMTDYCNEKFASGRSVCEIDHLIPIELCGATSQKNLWPQSYAIQMGAHTKDKLENRLHKYVCDGLMTLPDAQKQIKDWDKAYKHYMSVINK